MSNAELMKLTAEEGYGPDMAEMLNIPFRYELCAGCHEQEVVDAGDVCSACNGGEN